MAMMGHCTNHFPFLRSLRNKRPDLSGRPPCKGVAIGVARRGARLGGEHRHLAKYLAK